METPIKGWGWQWFGSAFLAAGLHQALLPQLELPVSPGTGGHSWVRWHFPTCRGVCRDRDGATAGAGSLPVLQILSPVISWPRCTAPAILSHLSICCFYFKFREGLVFPKAYLLLLTRLNGLITKKSTSSSQPCTSYLTFHTPPRSSCISHSTGSRVLSVPLKGEWV